MSSTIVEAVVCIWAVSVLITADKIAASTKPTNNGFNNNAADAKNINSGLSTLAKSNLDKIPVANAPDREMIIQLRQIIADILSARTSLIAMNLVRICGWPKYPKLHPKKDTNDTILKLSNCI